jgi:ribosomal protein S18 acetylase RimI-like enzyme
VDTVVAEENGKAVGFTQMQSDGVVQAHLSLILVARDRRRQGIGTRLVSEAFARSGGKRVDLLTEDAQEFYRSFAHKEQPGFRIYPDGKRPNP